MRRILFVLSFLFLSSFPALAWHIVGGEISYVCLGNNDFRITITLYQNCDGVNVTPEGMNIDNPVYYNIFNNDNNGLIKYDSTEFSSYEVVPVDFNNECVNNVPETCLGKLVFEFTVNLPPNEKGYTVAYARCCRTETILNIIAPAVTSAVYSCVIPPFPAGGCTNNSAIFNQLPPQILCVNNPLSIDFSATDPDSDSLTYELCTARYSTEASGYLPKPLIFEEPPYLEVPYLDLYSADNPIDAMPPLQINPVTGILTGTPIAVGRYIVTVCVNEWRNGNLITNRSRDLMFLITNCSKAVVANMPQYSTEPNTYIVACESKTVRFENISTGGNSYYWEFGVPGATSEEFEPIYTYPDTGTYEVKLIVNRGSTCPDSITRLVKVYPEFITDFSYTGDLCPGEIVNFTDNSISTYGDISYRLWNFGDGATSDVANPAYSYTKGGSYKVGLVSKNNLGCTDSASKVLIVPDFDPFAGNDTIIVKGYPFRLNASGGTNYHWVPDAYLSDAFIPDPYTSFPEAGSYTYIVEVTSGDCIGADTITVDVVNDNVLFLPSAFSPNGDGLNDILHPVLIGYSRFNFLRIYNRWGKMIFVTYSLDYGWDGTYNGQPAQGGVYFWETVVTTPWGTEVKKTGDVTLVR